MSSYDYGRGTPGDTRGGKKQTESEIWSWVLIVVCFIVFWPIGLFLLFRKLSEGSRKKAAPVAWDIPPLEQKRDDSAARQKDGATAQSSSRSTGGSANEEKFTQRMMRTPSLKKGTRLALKIVGALLLIGGVAAAIETVSYLSWPLYSFEIAELLQECAVLGAGGLMLGKGVSMDRAVRRYSKYLAVMGNVPSVSFRQLAETTGYSEKKVIDDLERMIEKNYFGPTAYLDMGLGYFFRSRSAARPVPEQKQQTAAADVPEEANEGYAGVLRAIRRANDRIADPVLSAKIDRLEEVSAQIFRAIEKDEKKEKQMHTFLEYYLPTTQKLLDSYAEFEAAGIDGENLRMAKEKIEETMDNIVAGFERQLDSLYAAEAMDIQSDIDVMNSMMQRDSAMHASDFTVSTGGTMPAGAESGTATAAAEKRE